jgi:hypothetical protein
MVSRALVLDAMDAAGAVATALFVVVGGDASPVS